MKKIFLCTAANEKYFNTKTFQNCLSSYYKFTSNSKIIPKVFIVDKEDKLVETHGINKIFINQDKIKSPNYNYCIQHGEFSEYLIEANDDDVIIFTDGDIIMQREINEKEIDQILNLSDNTFLANYNLFNGSTLLDYYEQFSSKDKLIDFLRKNFNIKIDDLKNMQEMNTGILIGTKKNFTELCNLYKKYYEEAKKVNSHFSNQQMLINILINKFFKYKNLSYEFHTHSHHSVRVNFNLYHKDLITKHGVPKPIHKKNDLWFFDDKLILFAHKLD